MNYGKIKYTDIANGPGVRVSLFVSGCRNHCQGCFQPETWDFNYGEEYTLHTKAKIIQALRYDHISGLTILGGDPIEPENITDVSKLCHSVKKVYGKTKTIWLYTGYLFEDIRKNSPELLDDIDVMVDGPFQEEKKDISLVFKGSSNQRIIDVRRSLYGEVKELEEYKSGN